MAGSANPGIPLIMIGRTKTISWGITAALTDVSDLYREKLSFSGDQYFLDGEWKDLEVVSHSLKVKGKDEPVRFDIKYTHRGPVITSQIIKNAQVLFGSQIPIHDDLGSFSLVWASHYTGESMFALLQDMMRSKTLYDVKKGVRKVKQWRSIPANIVMADKSGNIGYMLLSSSPMRKGEYPYLGCRVMDG